MFENYRDIVEEDYEPDDRSDEMYEKWRDERDERSFLDEEHMPDASKELNCTECGGKFIGHKNRNLCIDCDPYKGRSYPEDLNGHKLDYRIYCSECKKWFIGDRHRGMCKSCYLKTLKKEHLEEK